MPQTTPEWRSNATADELRSRAAEMRGEWSTLSQTDRESDTYRSAKTEFVAEVDDIDHHLTLAGLSEQRSARYMPAGVGFVQSEGAETRSAAGAVMAHAEFREWCARNASRNLGGSSSPVVEFRDLVQEGAPAVWTSGSDGGLLAPVNQPYLANVNRQRLFVRDLITVQPTGLSAVHYVRESLAVTNQVTASTVPEGGTKPETVVNFTADIAPVQVIAVNIPITTQILEDVQTLVGYLNGRLVYMVKLREEAEILAGNGLNNDIKGIRTYSGIQTQAATAGEFATTLGNAIAKVELVNGMADGVAMNPSDAWSMFIKRAAGGGGTFDAGTPFSSIPQTVWGLPVVRTLSMETGKSLVGSYSLGVTLFDRQQASARVYEQHSDFAVKNKVLLQVEERVALAVNRPDWFVLTTVS